MNRTRLYSTVLLACFAGLIWLGVQYTQHSSGVNDPEGVCMIRQVTGIPCPSCGTTRSVFALLDGDAHNALIWNPFGFVVLTIMLISPVWILTDILSRKESFFRWYGRMENHLRTKWIALPALALIIANWIWNITKGL